MRHHAEDLQTIYEILETYPKPLAVLDFFCGEVGHEFGAAQCLGGQFYDKYHDSAHVIALCWQGASILYANLSDDQIEFADKKRSRSGDKRHDGGRKIHWLNKMKHGDRIKKIKNVIAYQAPQDVAEKAMERVHGLGADRQWARVERRLTHMGFIFPAGEERPIQEPYIALFDRNERHQPERNTRVWQVRLFHRWAKSFGFKLVVISDFYPRQWKGVICIPFADRNLDRLCNVIRHSVLYATPPSGVGNAGMVFGCNFVALGIWSRRQRNIMPSIVEGRGFQHFGTLTEPEGDVANRVREYLMGLQGNEVFC